MTTRLAKTCRKWHWKNQKKYFFIDYDRT